MRASVVAMAAAAVVALGYGGATAGTPPRTALRITFWNNSGEVTPDAKWTLRCSPSGGTFPRPGRACAELAVGGVALFAPVPRGIACTQIYGGPQKARVVGVVAGKPVWVVFTRTDGCQIGRWNRLSPWLLPRGGVTGA